MGASYFKGAHVSSSKLSIHTKMLIWELSAFAAGDESELLQLLGLNSS